MRGAIATAVVTAVVGAACGAVSGEPAAEQPAQTATMSSNVLPATTIMSRPENRASAGSLVVTDVSEPCPTSAQSTGGDGSERMAESSRLEPMLGRVLAYGSEHADVFGSYGLVWHGGGDASVFVSFTGETATHQANLESVVEFPDELIVCQAPLSGQEAQALEAQLVAELSGRFLELGRGRSGAVDVVLRADEADLAQELQERYGDAINLWEGALAYPIESAQNVCSDPPTVRSLDGLVIEVIAPSTPVEPDEWSSLSLTMTLTNVGSEPIRFSSGIARGVVLGDDGSVVSVDVLDVPAIEERIDLEPGASSDVPLRVSAVSCDPKLGYRLPTGTYDVAALVPHPDGEITSSPVAVAVNG